VYNLFIARTTALENGAMVVMELILKALVSVGANMQGQCSFHTSKIEA
jgi:hypothetical protein